MYHGVCFLCGETGPLEEHHVFPAANRNRSEMYGLKVGLCGDKCHRNGRLAAHRCRETADGLKQFWQIKHMMRFRLSVSDFIREFGRNYLELDYYDDERTYPMNITAQSGRLVRDPELRRTGDGKPCCTFTIAVDRPGVKDKSDFLDCVAWDRKAEFVSKYFKKGSRIEVSGILTSRSYEAKDGTKRKATEIRCDQVFFGDSKNAGSTGAGGGYEGNAGSGNGYQNEGSYQSDFAQLPDDDDAELPF